MGDHEFNSRPSAVALQGISDSAQVANTHAMCLCIDLYILGGCYDSEVHGFCHQAV